MRQRFFAGCIIFVVVATGASTISMKDQNVILGECPQAFTGDKFFLPDVVSHRGMVPAGEEYSLNIIRMAFDRFPQGEIEIDVRETEDGELVLSHDPVRSSQNLTRLEEIFDLLGEYPTMRLQIDSKVSCGEGCVKLAEMILSRPDLAERIIVSSNDLTLQKLYRLYPDLNLGLDSGEKELNERNVDEIIQHARVLDANTVYLGYGLLARISEDIASQLVKKFQEAGLIVDVWTIDSQMDIMQVISLGVDKITTNRPEVFAQVVRLCVLPRDVVVAGFLS